MDEITQTYFLPDNFPQKTLKLINLSNKHLLRLQITKIKQEYIKRDRIMLELLDESRVINNKKHTSSKRHLSMYIALNSIGKMFINS